MGNLMILPAVEPKRISWLNEYATDAEVITDIPQREKKDTSVYRSKHKGCRAVAPQKRVHCSCVQQGQ